MGDSQEGKEGPGPTPELGPGHRAPLGATLKSSQIHCKGKALFLLKLFDAFRSGVFDHEHDLEVVFNKRVQ